MGIEVFLTFPAILVWMYTFFLLIGWYVCYRMQPAWWVEARKKDTGIYVWLACQPQYLGLYALIDGMTDISLGSAAAGIYMLVLITLMVRRPRF